MDLTDRLATERRGRLAAERLLELKSRELFEANKKLSQHARSLSGQIIEQRGEAERLKEHTEQVKADLQRAEHHVEVIERRLWDSVETITDGFAVFDAQDRLVAANTAWLSIFNFSERIGPGTLYLELLRIAVEENCVDLQGEDPGVWIGMMLERWDAAAPIPTQEARLRTGAWYRFVDRRARDGDMVCIAQNITAMKKREEELEEARHRAEAANRAKSSFLANMSHELRTPMNGVVAMAEMLLEGDMEDEARLYVTTIKSSGEALLDIINHVLDFSKMEAERMVLRPDPFDLERLLHEVVTLLGPTARDKNLSLHIDYDLFSPTRLVGDAMRIRQILINLVGNAVKFTSEGHVLIGVLCHQQSDEDWAVTVTVEDTGIGIPEDMQEHIFGSFAQVESEKNRAFEGTGLGLAITQELVHLMGGDIWVESEPGEGACFGFRITLPSAESPVRSLPHVDITIGRAMVVAPEGHESSILMRQLGQLGLEVASAASGSDALALARSAPPFQITVIDDALTDTTGAELAVALDAAHCASARILVCHAGPSIGGSGGPNAPLPPGIHGTLTRPMLRRDLFEAIANLPQSAERSKPLADVSKADMRGEEGGVVETPQATAKDPTVKKSSNSLPPSENQLRPEDAAEPDQASPSDLPHEDVGLASPHSQPQDTAATVSQTPSSPTLSAADFDEGASALDTAQPVDASSAPEASGAPALPAGTEAPATPDASGDAPVALVSTSPDADGPPPSPAPTLARRMRVLAAEDNKTNRFVLEKLLARMDIELKFALDGQEAVEMYGVFEPDLVLMDISMPRMDGKEAARAIRDQEAAAPPGKGCHVPIVAMTAHALHGDKEAILASGIDRYTTKPLKRVQLTEHILEFCPADCRSPVVEEAAAS
ncbi:MAG: ATP-binding protein [Pseudomonadota bacterium]